MAKEESTKIKKKRWYQILAPRLFGEKVIGETLIAEASLLQDRSISCNLMSLTNDVKSQHIYVKFIIREVKENKGFTELVSYEISPTYIKRVVRRGRERIDDSYLVKTKDGRILRIKPFLLTNGPAANSLVTKIRKALKQRIIEIVTQNEYDNIFEGVISYKIQRELRSQITKIFPTRTLEIRVLKEEKEKAGKIKHEEIVLEAKKDEEEASEDIEQEDEEIENIDKETEDIEDETEEESEETEDIEEEIKPKKKSKKKDADETGD